MADRKSATRTVYHIIDGPQDMYHVDAAHALQFKDEWRDKPWSDKQVERYKAKKAAEAKGEKVADEVSDDDETEKEAE